MSNIFEFRRELVDEYAAFSRSFTRIGVQDIRDAVDAEYARQRYWPEPLIQVNPNYKRAQTVEQLVAEGLLHPRCADIFRNGQGASLQLFQHQQESLVKSRDGQGYVVTTGTGSGKSLSFFIPIFDRILREKDIDPRPRTRAIVIYPMNALANSQLEEVGKFLDRFGEGRSPIRVARYTGQEKTHERVAIAENPPDILLTNFMMLELILTRYEEVDRRVVEHCEGLPFLVLDELHTYRGRQGADVALLVRRLRERFQARDMVCIGTSATMSSAGSADDRKAVVAGVASTLFGQSIPRENVIGETLERVTDPTLGLAAIRTRLGQRLAQGRHAWRTTQDFASDPLAVWVELNLGLDMPEGGRPERARPISLSAAAERLAADAGVGVDAARDGLMGFFEAAQHVQAPDGRALFAFKLHQFISGPGKVLCTLEPVGKRLVTLDAQRFAPGRQDQRVLLYAAHFCRDCGQEYHPVWRHERQAAQFLPREIDDTSAESGDEASPGFLAPRREGQDFQGEVTDFPDAWVDTSRDQPVLKPQYRANAPVEVRVDARGHPGVGEPFWFIPGKFRFCVNCGTLHEATGRDIHRLAAPCSGRSWTRITPACTASPGTNCATSSTRRTRTVRTTPPRPSAASSRTRSAPSANTAPAASCWRRGTASLCECPPPPFSKVPSIDIMKNPVQLNSAISDWFERHAKAALQKTEKPQQIKEFERQAKALHEQATRLDSPFRVAVLGQARVGKSTLINALVADTATVVPSGGGDGPLTANALVVRFGQEKRFTVRYHPRKKINEMLFGLERKLDRESSKAGSVKAPPPIEPAEAEGEDMGNAAADLELTPDESKKPESEELVRQVRLIIAGSPSVDRSLTYLIDGLRHVLGKPPKHGTSFVSEDAARLTRLKEAVESGTAKRTREFANLPPKEFQAELRLHASGHLAPLIYEMHIEWPSPTLQEQIEIVDLPGLGVHNDPFESVTTQYLRSKAQAVMLVTDSGGVRRNEASLLRDFLNRLLHAGDNPAADPVTLIMAVVQIDNIALERWRNDREENGGTALKTKAQHFEDLVTTIRQSMVKQLSDLLTETWQSADEALQRDKASVIQRLMAGVRIFPLSAPQYRDILSADPEHPPFLKSPESTQVPALKQAICELARGYRHEKEARLGEAAGRFFGQLRARLMVASAQLSSDTKALGERQALENQLAGFLGPKQREFDTRRGAFRNYLRETIPEQIHSRVLLASEVAQKEINAYLAELRGYHWSTLRASVRRNGVFHGARHIQLPHDFALRFEEPIAQVWSTQILRGLRQQTAQFADYQATLLTEILDWAKQSGIKVTIKLLEALINDVQEQRKQLNAVGKEAIEELRAAVNKQLLERIEEPIRRRCEAFVRNGDDIGTGVSLRMHALFRTLATDVVAAAQEPAVALLTTRFREVETEIAEALKQHSNPVKDAEDALLQKLDHQWMKEGERAAEALQVVRGALVAIPAGLEDAATPADGTQ